MSVLGWIKKAGRYIGRKTIGAAKVIGRGVGKVARGGRKCYRKNIKCY